MTMNRKMRMIAAAGLLGLCGCAGMARGTKPVPEERLDERGVSAPAITVEAGGALRFVNADARPHQIYSNDCPELSSTVLNPGDAWSATVGDGIKVCHFHDLLAPLAIPYSGTVEVHDDLAEWRMRSPE